jgi:hypothetical protein
MVHPLCPADIYSYSNLFLSALMPVRTVRLASQVPYKGERNARFLWML